MLRTLAALAVLVASPGVSAQADYRPCESQRNTIELNDCALQDFQAADRELNRAYRALLDDLPTKPEDGVDYPEVRRLLVRAQRAWIAFRRDECEAIYKLNEPGSLRNIRFHGCMTERTLQRVKELKAWNAP